MNIKPACIDEADNIVITSLSDSQIEQAKSRLIKRHVANAVPSSNFPIEKSVIELCNSRLFFVQFEDRLVLCGVYKTHIKRDMFSESWGVQHYVYDYLLYSQEAGFFILENVSSPIAIADNSRCTSPALYIRNSQARQYTLLKYGQTYQADNLFTIQIKCNVNTYISREEKLFEIAIIQDQRELVRIPNASLYSELPLEPGFFVYTCEKSHSSYNTLSHLVDYNSQKTYPIRCGGQYSYPFNFSTGLPFVAAHADSNYALSDQDNYYFYVGENDTIAYSHVMKCADQFGTAMQMENLFKDDASRNFLLSFPKSTRKDVISFVCGVISKSRVIYPVILGCPIHDVVEILCRGSADNPYTLPEHSIDEISAENVVKIIRKRRGNLSDWQIVLLLAQTYGYYCTLDRYSKDTLYHFFEHIQFDYLPGTVGNIVNEEINGQYIKKLANSTIGVKWKSEFRLYCLVLMYYPTATFHYTAEWLGKQHLDIYIPDLKIGIEYQGEQHYEPTDFFGGHEAFGDRQFLDEKKRALCLQNGVTLIEWPYSYPVTAADLIIILDDLGVKEIPIPSPLVEMPVDEPVMPEEKAAISIRQYSLDGKFLTSYASYIDAENACVIPRNAIYKAVSGQNKTAGGYQWRRALVDEPEADIAPVGIKSIENTAKAICQISVDGEIIAEYESIGKAVKATGINHKSIRSVLNGAQKTAGGYYWQISSDSRTDGSPWEE